MPNLPLRPCTQSGCPALTTTGRCAAHPRLVRPVVTTRRFDDRRGSSTARGYGYEWQQRRKKFITEHPYCVRCGKPTTDVDHKMPRSQGGSDEDYNLQGLCGYCHKQKTARERRKGK